MPQEASPRTSGQLFIYPGGRIEFWHQLWHQLLPLDPGGAAAHTGQTQLASQSCSISVGGCYGDGLIVSAFWPSTSAIAFQHHFQNWGCQAWVFRTWSPRWTLTKQGSQEIWVRKSKLSHWVRRTQSQDTAKIKASGCENRNTRIRLQACNWRKDKVGTGAQLR